MKRFIDLQDQISQDTREFAFYCTIVDKFETFSGCCTWTSRGDFTLDFSSAPTSHKDLDRYLNLIPKEIL